MSKEMLKPQSSFQKLIPRIFKVPEVVSFLTVQFLRLRFILKERRCWNPVVPPTSAWKHCSLKARLVARILLRIFESMFISDIGL